MSKVGLGLSLFELFLSWLAWTILVVRKLTYDSVWGILLWDYHHHIRIITIAAFAVVTGTAAAVFLAIWT